jgi:soluble lytic murein transglycosylase
MLRPVRKRFEGIAPALGLAAVVAVAVLLAGCVRGCSGDSPQPLANRATASAARSLVPTFTPQPSVTPSPTLSPTPTDTPVPSARLRIADRLRRIGDYDGALAQYAQILAQPADPAAVEATFRVGETQYRAGQTALAAETLQRFLADHGTSRWAPYAHFLLGEIARSAGDWPAAIKHYRAYGGTDSVIAPYVAERLAEAYEATGQTDLAIEAYQAIVSDPDADRVWRTLTAEKIANHYFEAKEYEQALKWYDTVLAGARIGYYRAEMEYRAGLALEGLGREEEAWKRFAIAVVQYPATEYALKSLEALQEANYRVNPYQQGLIQFYNGQFKLAITLFRRYLAGNQTPLAPHAHYYIALAYERLGNTTGALRELDGLIAAFPRSDMAGKAQLEKARLYARQGEIDKAVKAYRLLAEKNPENRLAAQGLWKAAELIEQNGQPVQAASAYEELATRYPHDEGADDALDRAAMIRYQAGDLAGAQADWIRLARTYPDSDRRGKALYWAGKAAEASGDAQAAQTLWREAATTDAEGYYGRRAADRLANRRPVVSSQKNLDLTVAQADMRAVEGWVEQWAGSSVTATVPTPGVLPESVRAELAYRRGRELLALGLRSEALEEFHRLIDEYQSAPWTLYALARDFEAEGLPSLSIAAAEALFHLSPAKTFTEAPRGLQQMVYPLPYADLVKQQARVYRLDPLLLASLIWQESRWEPAATSGAQALGLAQVIPDTGRWIALQLRQRDFRPQDLYRPMIGVQYGAYYLARQLDAFHGDVLRALAAYNAGPGNARRWDDPDPDMFVENIDVPETRRYVEAIYAHFRAYELVYRANGRMGESANGEWPSYPTVSELPSRRLGM